MILFFLCSISDATLTCYSQKDSTEIYNVTGIYYPEIQLFKGSKRNSHMGKGRVSRGKMYLLKLKNYTINTAKNSFTVDSARLTHNAYFKKPEFGQLYRSDNQFQK